jgi:hypothetical protein
MTGKLDGLRAPDWSAPLDEFAGIPVGCVIICVPYSKNLANMPESFPWLAEKMGGFNLIKYV